MNVHDYRFLLSERATLNELIAETGPEEVIVRSGFEHRLHEVEAELEAYEGLSSRVVDARLTFRGAPVAGSRGMSADFSSAALKDFNKSIQSIAASRQQEKSLSPKRKNSGRSNYELMVTGTAKGSFGFVLEQSSQEMALNGESTPVAEAIEQLKMIFKASVGTDEELEKAVENVDQRALKSVADFLSNVAKKNAVCALEFRGEIFRFQDTAQVQRSAVRLNQDNIKEDDVRLRGQFQGFLPTSRQAEILIQWADSDFLTESVRTVIKCRVKPAPKDALSGYLPDINDILHRDVRVDARTRRVGSGRPSFTLTHWELME